MVIFQPVPCSSLWKLPGGFLVSRTAGAWLLQTGGCLWYWGTCPEQASVTAEVSMILHAEEGLNTHSCLSFMWISFPWAAAFLHRTAGAYVFGPIAPLPNLVRTSRSSDGSYILMVPGCEERVWMHMRLQKMTTLTSFPLKIKEVEFLHTVHSRHISTVSRLDWVRLQRPWQPYLIFP